MSGLTYQLNMVLNHFQASENIDTVFKYLLTYIPVYASVHKQAGKKRAYRDFA